MTRTLLAGFLLCVALPARAEVTLDDVLESVRADHPMLAVQAAEVAAARADARAARGEFDPTLSATGRIAPTGYYSPRRLDVTVEQPTPLLGASVYAGYRIGRGKIADYYGEQRTLNGGEVRAGARLPLWQDRGLDARRAGRASTDAVAEASEADAREFGLMLERDAAVAYFSWVAAGQRYRVLEGLLALAEERDAQLASKVKLGAVPSIERTDNQRTILERRQRLVAQRRSLEKAATELSLFLRHADGTPRVVGLDDVPVATDEPPSDEPRDALARALEKRPVLDAVAADVSAARIERDLAENRVSPRLDVMAEVSRDLGDGPASLTTSLGPTVTEVGVVFSIPLALRKARGKRDATAAKLRAVEEKARFARDKVSYEVRDALSALTAARERIALTREAARVAEEVAQGERTRLELGSTTILFVNLREQASADARSAVIEAEAEGAIAWARLLAATGDGL